MTITTPYPPLEDLTESLIREQLRPWDQPFANTDEANNHLNIGYEEVSAHLRPEIVEGLGELIVVSKVQPIFIAPVPKGANGWGEELVEKLPDRIAKPALLTFEKVDKRKFANLPEADKEIAKLKAKHNRPTGVVIDDATTDGGTSEAMADFLTEQGLAVDLVLSIFYRGDIRLLSSNYRRAVLVTRHLPLMLDWKKYLGDGTIRALPDKAN